MAASRDDQQIPTRLASIPGYLIRRSQAVHSTLWARLVPGDLTGPQYAALSALATFPQSDLQQVARVASLDKSSAADVVSRLVRKGWIERKRNPDDARRYVLSLTDAAAGALSAITRYACEVQDALLAPLPVERQTTFVAELAAVARLSAAAPPVTYPDTYQVLALNTPGHLIRRAQQVHTAYWTDIMGGQLTSPQYAVLDVVGRLPEINQRRLGELAALDSSTTTDLVNRLAGRGWVTREKDKTDGRGRVLTLTCQAKTWLEEIRPKVELVQQRLLEPLPAAERSEFLRELACMAFEGAPPEEAYLEPTANRQDRQGL